MIGWRHAIAVETIVGVTSLLPGEPIEAHAVSCAGQDATSAVVVTEGIGDLLDPRVEAPLHSGTRTVRIHQVQVGARLDVYVDDAFAGGLTVTSDPAEVTLPEALVAGQRVHGRQGICNQWRSGEPEVVTTAPATPPPAARGFGKVVILNCHTWQRTIEVWSLDHTTGSVTKAGSLHHNYDDWGTCPAAGEPLEVELDDGHEYEIVFVDPEAIGCEGQDDPMVLACRRDVLPIIGSTSGPAFTKIVN
jgi:hypothetical protein